MADLKGSGASTVAAVADTTRFIVSHGGADAVATGLQIGSYLGNAIRKVSSTPQAISAATLTKIANSDLAVPTGGIRVGTVFHWRIIATKTAFGTAARTFHVRIGTAGSIADTAVATITSALGTAAADAAVIDITCICTTIGGSGAFETSLMLTHNGNTAGFSTTPVQVVSPATSTATRDTTVANLIATVSVTSGASEVITVRQVVAEALNL